jgi:hypothetical protein
MNNLKSLLLILFLSFAFLSAKAIITDPEDHVYYFSGTLAPSRAFEIPDFLGGQDWSYGSSEVVLHRTMYEHFELAPGDTAYALIVNHLTGTVTLDLPFCDSIYIEFWGTGRRGIHITNNLNDDYAWNAAEGNQVVSVGGRFRIQDSVKLTLTPTGLDIGARPTGLLFINSIKIYGMIEEGQVPVFDGQVAGWDFKYRPKASGTVNLEEVVTNEDGVWETDYYPLYASDLGVVRAKLSYLGPAEGMQLGHDCGQQAVMLSPAGKNTQADYRDAVNHESYYQIELSTLGFQELSLAFDYNLRESADSLVVVYSTDEAASFSVAGVYPALMDYSEMRAIEVAIPDITNKARVLIRLLPAAGDYNPNGEFLLANLEIKGFEYRAYKPEALNLAYINTAENRIRIAERAVNTKDSTDTVLLPALLDRYNLTVFYPDMYNRAVDSVSINALFKDYDVVVLSDYPEDSAQITLLAKYLLGNKPLLNLKAHAYSVEQAWDWADTQDVLGNYDSNKSLKVDQAFSYHPLFSGLNLDTMNGFAVFDTLAGAEAGLQALITESYMGPEAQMIASPVEFPEWTSIQEINSQPEAKYLLIGLASEQFKYLSQDAVQLIFNAVDYLGSKTHFALPDFEMTAAGARVSTLSELKAALSYDYGAMKLDEIVIELQDCRDEGGIYLLDKDGGLTFPQTFQDLSIKAAEGHNPQLFGSFSSNNGMKVRRLSFEGLRFEALDSGQTDYNALAYSPFYLNSVDSISEIMQIRDCQFKRIPTQYLIYVDPAGPAMIPELTVEHCTIEGQSPVENSLNEGLIYISDKNHFQCDRVVFRHNIIKNFGGNKLFGLSRAGTTALQPNFSVTIDNNLFYNFIGSSADVTAFLEYNQDLGGENAFVQINNNLFYQNSDKPASLPDKLIFPSALAEQQQWTVQVLNNYFCPDDLMRSPGDTINLQAEGGLTVIYKQLLSSVYTPEADVFEDESTLSMSKSSPLYMAGNEYDCVGPEQCYVERHQAGTIRVHSAKELEKALEIAIGGDTIELGNCADPAGRYLLGNSGKIYPRSQGSLLIKAAPGHRPVLFGRLSSSNGMRVDTLRIEGLTWDGGDKSIVGYNSDTYAPFYINRADTITNAFIIQNCTFINLDYQPIIRTNACKFALIGKIQIEKCTFDNMGWERASGNQGYHFMQFDSRRDYQLDHFEFRNNIVKNFHGSQLFNISREGSTSTDSAMSISIEHNTFYKLGGNGTTQRQFLGFDKNPKATDVKISINNNLFYKRWSLTHYSISNLALFIADSTQQVELKVLNNFFYPEDVVVQKYDDVNLEVSSGNIKAEYNNLYMSSLYLDSVFQNEDSLLISATSPLYTAGVDGSYIGAIQCYTGIIDGICHPSTKPVIRVFSREAVLYLQLEQADEIEIYNLFGQKVGSHTLSPGLNQLEGLQPGQLYLLKIGRETIKHIIQ